MSAYNSNMYSVTIYIYNSNNKIIHSYKVHVVMLCTITLHVEYASVWVVARMSDHINFLQAQDF